MVNFSNEGVASYIEPNVACVPALSMNKDLAKTSAKAFTAVATLTPVSEDDAAATKVLDDFKTSAATIRLGLTWKSGDVYKSTNKVTAVAFTETGASAMTTFAIGLAAAAALF